MNRWFQCLGLTAAILFCLPLTASASVVSSWDFDEGTGTTTSPNEGGIADATLDSSGSGSPPSWIAGQSGASGDNALDFVGSFNDLGYASSPTTGLYNFAVDGEFSVGAWLRMPVPAGTTGLINTLNGTFVGWGLNAFNTGLIKLEVKPNGSVVGNPGLTYDATALMDDTDWFHVTATYEGKGLTGGTSRADLKIYINGNSTPVAMTEVDFGLDLTGQNFSDNPLYFGAYGNNSRGYTGSLDSAIIFDHALTGAEVQALVFGDAVPEPSTLLLLVGGLTGLCCTRRRRR